MVIPRKQGSSAFHLNGLFTPSPCKQPGFFEHQLLNPLIDGQGALRLVLSITF